MSTSAAPAPVEEAAPVTVETQPETASTSPDNDNFDLNELTREVLADMDDGTDVGAADVDGVDVEKHLDAAGLPERDEHGRFKAAAPKDGEEAPEAEAIAEDATPENPTPDDTPKPERAWKAFDANGVETEPPALEIEFKADGKVMKKPLADVVRLAQRGQYNERLHEEVEGARTLREQEVPRLQAAVEQAQSEASNLANAMRALLADEDQYLAAREQYAGMLTPEAEVERLRAQLEQQQQQTVHQQAAHSTRELLATQVVPALTQMAAQYTTVPQDELMARYAAFAKPYVVGGVVPPNRLPDVVRALEETAYWAESLHESRSETARLKAAAETARQQAERDKVAAEKAQREARDARRTVARAVAPSGRAAPDVPRQAPARTADEAAEQAIDRALDSLFAG